MPADWLDEVIETVGETLDEDLELLVDATLHQASAEDDPITGDAASYTPRSVKVLRGGYTGVKLYQEGDEPAAQHEVRLFDVSIPITTRDYLTWGTTGRRHRVLLVKGLERASDGTRYGATAVTD